MSIPHHDDHICLVSEQTLPNYLGVLMSDPLPKTVHLLVTSVMRQRSKDSILGEALKRKGCKVEFYHLEDESPSLVFERLCAIEEKLGKSVAVNVTCGTKPMALTAVEWATLSEHRPFVFYVDTVNGKVRHMAGNFENYDLDLKLRIPELLLAGSGHTILDRRNEEPTPERVEVLKELLELFLRDYKALIQFNECAAKAEFKRSAPDYQVNYVPFPDKAAKKFFEALEIAQSQGMLSCANDSVVFASEETRFWCNGGWLEEYAHAALASLRRRKLVDDYGSNLKLDFTAKVSGVGKDDPQNEIDAAFARDNSLYLIECKTSIMHKKKGAFSKATDAIYKLSSLRRQLGGTFGKGMIVSVFKPDEVDLFRAKELGLKVVHGSKVQGLEGEIAQWIGNGKG